MLFSEGISKGKKHCPDSFRLRENNFFYFFIQTETLLQMACFCSTVKHQCFLSKVRGAALEDSWYWSGWIIYHSWVNIKFKFMFNRHVTIKLTPRSAGSCQKSSLHPAENPCVSVVFRELLFASLDTAQGSTGCSSSFWEFAPRIPHTGNTQDLHWSSPTRIIDQFWLLTHQPWSALCPLCL